MKKNYAFSVITFLTFVLSSFGQMTDLIISEYCEGSSFNKYVEIYNGTGLAIDLSDYELWRITNGGAWPEDTHVMSGILANGDTYIVANGSAVAAITSVADAIDTGFTIWNGDDAVGLAKDIAGTFTLIDAVGTDGADPGSGWAVAGTANSTQNNTLVRKDNVCSPNTNWTTSAGTTVANSEWIVLAQDDFSDINSHTEFCSSTDTFVQFTNTSSTLTEDGLFIDVCVAITNPSATVATTVDITLNGSSTATNGTDFDDGAGTPMAIAFPVTLTFPANSSANECITIHISNDDTFYEGDETVVLDLSNPTGGTSAGLGAGTQHELTILDNETPVIADVIITEIMYNTSGADDEWIEICNTTGLNQILNNYTIEVNTFTRFTFPATGVVLTPGQCMTIGLGDNGVAPFNHPCPFTPDYLAGIGTDILPNSPAITGIDIELIADDGTTVVDLVNYDDADGGDGNNASLHVTDDSLDNSDTGTNWQEVIDGGSPGFNTLISQCSSPEPEINVEGNINSFNDIPDGLINTPNPFDNTLFSTIALATSEARTFRIQNIGTVDLNVSNIQILGTNAGDFAITSPAVLSFPVQNISTGNNVEIFEVTFTPTAAGERNAYVRITNDDSADGEGEEIYEFNIRGNAFCTTSSNTLTPLTGPDLTVVTITGSDLDGTTTVEFGGAVIPHTSISPTEIEVTIPANSSTGGIIVTNNLNCQTTDVFLVIDNAISTCQGSTGLSPTDLFISEITDAPTGSHTYVEIYNGTGAAVDLEHYEIRVHNNGSSNPGGDIADLTGILADQTVYVIGIGGTNATDPEGGFTADAFFSLSGINDNDNVRLHYDDGVNPPSDIDLWGDTSGSSFTIAAAGYTYQRKNTGITVPRVAGWNAPDNMQNDWDAITPVDYSDIGMFDFSTGAPPTINTQPVSTVSSCDLTASFSLTASEGFAGGLPLAYQWLVSAPGDSGWATISDGATYSGTNTTTLNVLNTLGLDGYQFYCQVRENLSTCFTASNAVRLATQSTNWIGPAPGSWTNGVPDINTIAVMDFDYSTAVESSFSACRLVVNNGATLTISDNTYVEVDTHVTVDGNILVNSYGSFVQVDDTGIINGDVLSTPSRITVEKTTAILNSYQEYTYWSSPVSGETIGNGLNESDPNRRFLFNAQNYRDSQMENMNDNATDPGQDDIDDNGDDWQFVNGATVMSPGVGYAATHSVAGYTGPGNQYQFNFEGPFNNGVFNVPVYRNDGEGADNNWNFIGNPYPSAVFANDFFSTNVYDVSTNPAGALEGAIYLWSHNTGADDLTNGNEVQNYDSGDYAIINGTGELPGGDGITPSRYIPSGQGFFVIMSDGVADTPVTATVGTADVVFNNSMRDLGNNSLFFRNANLISENKLKLNLTSDNGVFSQILVGYVNGASDDFDGFYFDAPRNLSTGTHAIIYSEIENNDKRFAIQGKSPSALSMEEIIPLGFYTSITEATIYSISVAEFEGEFMSTNSIYLIDKLLNITHNLSESDYAFTSDIGDFNGRFDIVFQPETLSTIENELDENGLSIVELDNGSVKFSVSNNLHIEQIQIIDLLGRTLYNLPGSESTEIFELSNISQSVYVAKVKLSNGQIITKRAIKRL